MTSSYKHIHFISFKCLQILHVTLWSLLDLLSWYPFLNCLQIVWRTISSNELQWKFENDICKNQPSLFRSLFVNPYHIWGLWQQKQVSQAGVRNYIPQFTVGCNYLSLSEIPASGTKVLICPGLFQTRPVLWLLMPWLPVSLGHQQPWYWPIHIRYMWNCFWP